MDSSVNHRCVMCQQEIPQTQKALSYHMLVKHGFDLEDYYEYCVISNRPEELRSQASELKGNYPVELVEGYDTWKNKCVWRCAKCPNFSARLEAGQVTSSIFFSLLFVTKLIDWPGE